MSDLHENDTAHRGLPVALGPSRPRPSLAQTGPNAAFVSQLIAARDRLTPQRSHHRGTPEGAAGAYGNGARMTERRMPIGYRKTKLA